MFGALRQIVTSLAVASLIGSAAQAYASSSTAAPASSASISTAGLAIQDVRYEASPAFVDAVTFRASSSGATIKIRLNPNTDWVACQNTAGDVRCSTPNFPASAVTQLSVAAS